MTMGSDRRRVARRCAWLLGMGFLGSGGARAWADAAPPAAPGAVENVTVTAQKRKQKIQDVPISITVLDAKALRRLNVQTSDELAQYVPSVEIAMPSGKGNQPLIAIRGVGLNDTNTNNAGPNGVYVDEVYQASPAGQTFQTFDLSRVEVLKGPQGTLYGRNTTGGAINYVTNKPTDDFAASEDVQYGSWNSVTSQSVVNGQLTPGIDGRVAILYDYSDGYFKDLTDHNVTNGANDLAYRGELLINRIDNLDLLFNFHGGYVNRRPDEYKQVGTLTGPGSGTQCSNPMILAGDCTDVYGYKAPPGFYSGFYNRDQDLRINAIGGSARADYHLGDITLTSLTAIEMSHKNHPEDTDAEPYDLIQINYGVRSTDITEELRAAGGGTDYHWLTGLYFLDEHLNQDQPIQLFHDIDQVFGFPGIGDGLAEQARTLNGQFTESVAAFGQGDYEIFPNARLTLGGRLTYEHKAFDAFSQAAFETNGGFPATEAELYNISENLADRAASWHAGFDYKITPTVLAYITASTGFKSGGFNGGFLANDVPEALVQLRPIKPEYITAYEAGLKTDVFDQRLRFNAAIFDYTYHDLQIYNIVLSPLAQAGNLPLSVLENAPKAFIRGAEFEADASPIEHLTTSISLSFLDAKLGQFVSGAGTSAAQNFTGNQFPNAPKFNAIFSADYAQPLARGDVVELSSTATYRAHQFFESSNNPLVAQNGYWLLDARLSYTSPNKKWDIAVLGKNLTGTQYLNFSNDLTSGFGILEEIVGPPRYVGGELVYRY
jgi:iron complex outermembrane receptor protein